MTDATWPQIVDDLIKGGLLGVLYAGGRKTVRLLERAGPVVAALVREYLADRREERAERAAERAERARDREAATGGAAAMERFTAGWVEVGARFLEVAARLEAALRSEVTTTQDLERTRTSSLPPAISEPPRPVVWTPRGGRDG